MLGTIKFFNDMKKFGFITDDSDGKEHYFNSYSLVDGDNIIYKYSKVEFDLETYSDGRTRAINVRLL